MGQQISKDTEDIECPDNYDKETFDKIKNIFNKILLENNNCINIEELTIYSNLYTNYIESEIKQNCEYLTNNYNKHKKLHTDRKNTHIIKFTPLKF